jgi:hypothetical protein
MKIEKIEEVYSIATAALNFTEFGTEKVLYQYLLLLTKKIIY